MCCGKRVPVAQLDGLSAIGCAMTCNGEPAAATSSSSQVDIAGLQAQLAALVPTPPVKGREEGGGGRGGLYCHKSFSHYPH